EPAVLHASAEQRDGPMNLAAWLGDRGKTAEVRSSDRNEGTQAPPHEGPRERLERGHEPQQLLAWEDHVEPEPSDEPRPAGAERLDLHASALHHPTERDVRRAHVLAGSARE